MKLAMNKDSTYIIYYDSYDMPKDENIKKDVLRVNRAALFKYAILADKYNDLKKVD